MPGEMKNQSTNFKKTVFLDRDGTIIIDKVYLNDPEQIEYLPGVFDALKSLRDAGYHFTIVTNQSGVARGLVTLENLNEIHRRIALEFGRHGIDFDGFYFAPYSVESNHFMRKPNPGMLTTAAEERGIDLSRSWMIGDRATDVQAGHQAGCRSILLSGLESQETIEKIKPDYVADDLNAMARFILASAEISIRDLA
jgi:D-glycero-D-manno-heptose 1,7-bisphosphate phosphatase